ncbi:hypothetical protein Ocepr_0055 [Oceanithermus profundus DSM 14977]|uniref:Uncharacterized protein n=2 Tax=Oceanithermus profundus TaxID=187137 RepID=E4U699_OCEP5|nr:hypothetical protein Ocepr_0055 [Oceanithermus profundus DSM 14977]
MPMTGRRLRAAVLAWLGGLVLASGAAVQGWQWGTPAWEGAFAASPGAVAGWTAGGLFAPVRDVDAFVVRFDGSKPRPWQSELAGLERAYALLPAAGGRYLAGTRGGAAGDAMRAQTDAWLARLDDAGRLVWQARVGGRLTDEARALAPAPDGGVYLAGFGEGRVFGPGAGGRDAFVARFAADGRRLWGAQWGTDDDDVLTAAAPDGAGGVYLDGYSDVDEDCRRVSERGFVLRYGPTGELAWAYRWGLDAASRPVALAADGAGVWVLGQTDGSLYGAFAGGRDAFVLRLTADGAPAGGVQWGSPAADLPYALARDVDGTLWAAGATAGALFAASAGGFDAFLARLDPAGRPAWGWQAGTPARDEARALGLRPGGGVWLAGVSYGSFFAANAGQADAWAALLRPP